MTGTIVRKALWSSLLIAGLMMPGALVATPAMAKSEAASPQPTYQQVAVLGGMFGRPAQAPRAQPDVHLAQVGDPRITSLEEQVRSLNGKIEELNFLILQMQEQLRKQQEDNEFRFQELEGGAKPAGTKRTDAAPTGPDAPSQSAARPATGTTPGQNSAAAGSAVVPPLASSGAQASAQGTAPTTQPNLSGTLGSIRFDAKGNLIGGTLSEEPVDLLSGTQTNSGGQDNTTVAALPSTDDPEELYRNSYEFILSGDYKTAEAGFRSYIERFPEAARVPDANFWLGEALASQNRHRDAAEVFLSASREFPESKKAPDTLLKLGMSLNALKQREVACATFREVGTRYPKASDALKERVRQEIASNSC